MIRGIINLLVSLVSSTNVSGLNSQIENRGFETFTPDKASAPSVKLLKFMSTFPNYYSSNGASSDKIEGSFRPDIYIVLSIAM